MLISLFGSHRHQYNLSQHEGPAHKQSSRARPECAGPCWLGWSAAGPGGAAVRSLASGSEMRVSVAYWGMRWGEQKPSPLLLMHTAPPLPTVHQSEVNSKDLLGHRLQRLGEKKAMSSFSDSKPQH